MARHPTYGEAILWLIMTIENAWVDVLPCARNGRIASSLERAGASLCCQPQRPTARAV